MKPSLRPAPHVLGGALCTLLCIGISSDSAMGQGNGRAISPPPGRYAQPAPRYRHIPGYYTTRLQWVCVEPARFLYRPVFDCYGCVIGYDRCQTPPRYDWREERIWVPDRWELLPAPVLAPAPAPRPREIAPPPPPEPKVIPTFPALLFELVDTNDPVVVGEELVTYRIFVENQGTANATGVQIECAFDPGLEIVEINGPTTAADGDASSLTLNAVDVLVPGDRATWDIQARAHVSGDLRFRASLNADHLDEPVAETEATQFYE